MLDHQKIKSEERLDGKYLLRTSDPSLSTEDIALGYKQLLEAERSFRDLKGVLRLRPVSHSKDERIRAHILICFLALVIIRVAETRTSETWRTIRAELGTIRQGLFSGQDGQFTQTTELTRTQRELHTRPRRPRAPTLREHHPRLTRPQAVSTHAQAAQSPVSPAFIEDSWLYTHLPRAEVGWYFDGSDEGRGRTLPPEEIEVWREPPPVVPA